MSQKTIRDMKNELRAALLNADSSERPEALVRLCLVYGVSGKYSVTADDLARVMRVLCLEFGISDEEIHDAMDQSELPGEVWHEGGDVLKTRH
jgi:hypothetical protein